MTKNDIKDLNKLAELHKIRTARTSDIDELQFLALMERGVYVLKTALIQANTLNRTAWLTEVLTLKNFNDELVKETFLIKDFCFTKVDKCNGEVDLAMQFALKISNENLLLKQENERLKEQLAQLTN